MLGLNQRPLPCESIDAHEMLAGILRGLVLHRPARYCKIRNGHPDKLLKINYIYRAERTENPRVGGSIRRAGCTSVAEAMDG